MDERQCYRCLLFKPLKEFVKDSRCKKGFRHLCKDCRNVNEKKWREQNPELMRAKRKRYAEKHGDKIRAYQRKYRRKNPKRYKAITKRYREKLKLEILTHYGGDPPKCACCGESTIEFLTIDHIKGGGYRHRRRIIGNIYTWLKKNDFPKEFRVLCMNCNFSIGKYGYCPHKNRMRKKP
jgi:Ser-tRNA(Ala) deacylase AlaX